MKKNKNQDTNYIQDLNHGEINIPLILLIILIGLLMTFFIIGRVNPLDYHCKH
jgi:hypothetical protein